MKRGELLAVDLGEDDEDVGEAAVGDPHLLAVQHEAAVGLPRRLGPRAERVGPGAGLAQRVGADDLAGDEPRQVASASASSVPKQRIGVIVSPVCAPKVVANDAQRADRLADDRRTRPCRARARRSASGTSVAEQAELRRSRRPASRASAQSFVSSRSSVGQDLLVDELLGRLADQPMLVGEPSRA